MTRFAAYPDSGPGPTPITKQCLRVWFTGVIETFHVRVYMTCNAEKETDIIVSNLFSRAKFCRNSIKYNAYNLQNRGQFRIGFRVIWQTRGCSVVSNE